MRYCPLRASQSINRCSPRRVLGVVGGRVHGLCVLVSPLVLVSQPGAPCGCLRRLVLVVHQEASWLSGMLAFPVLSLPLSFGLPALRHELAKARELCSGLNSLPLCLVVCRVCRRGFQTKGLGLCMACNI